MKNMYFGVMAIRAGKALTSSFIHTSTRHSTYITKERVCGTKQDVGSQIVGNGVTQPSSAGRSSGGAAAFGRKLSRILVRRGYITEQQLLAVLESILGIPHVQFDHID